MKRFSTGCGLIVLAWSASQAAAQVTTPNTAACAPALVVNGHVYFGAREAVEIYGLPK
jgi:hypothetical protein